MTEEQAIRYRDQKFQELIYSLNQPYLKSGTQSAYTNFSILDMDHMAKFFGDKRYPDGTKILTHINEIQDFQKYFLDYIGELRQEKWYTFPVISASLLFEDGDFVDKRTAMDVIDHNHKFGFNDVNIMPTEEVTSAASCCRLVSNIKDLRGATFNSIGGSDLNVGSTKVVTLNLARYGLESVKEYDGVNANVKLFENEMDRPLLKNFGPELYLYDTVRAQVKLIHQYHYAQRNTLKKLIKKGVLPLYTHKMMSLEDQFATIGINGLYECIFAMGGIDVVDGTGAKYNEYGYYLAKNIFDIINEENETTMDIYGFMSNVEQVPAESAAIKLSKKDRIYFGDMYVDSILGDESYIYANQWIPLKETAGIFDRIEAAAKLDGFCGGGAILHVNLGEPFRSVDDAYNFTIKMANMGVKYFSYISLISICDKDHSFFGETCPICGGPKTAEGIKVVGYLVKSSSYKKERKKEFEQRKFHTNEELQ